MPKRYKNYTEHIKSIRAILLTISLILLSVSSTYASEKAKYKYDIIEKTYHGNMATGVYRFPIPVVIGKTYGIKK